MVTIEYGPVKSHVSSDDAWERKAVFALLDAKLSFFQDGYFFSPQYEMGYWDGKQHFFSVATGKLYSGFVTRALQYLKQQGVPYTLVGYPARIVEYDRITAVELNPDITLRAHQLDAVRQVARYMRGTLQIATNGGKTEVAAGIMKVHGIPPAVYYVPRALLVNQVASRLETRLNIDVGRVGAGFDKPNPNGVTVAMTQTTAKRLKAKPKLDYVRNALITIGDECHLLSDVRYQYCLEHTNATIRVLMSGTPFRKNPAERGFVQGLGGPLLSVVDNDEMVDKGISAKPNVLYLEPKPNIIQQAKYRLMDYRYAIAECIERNELAAAITRAFVACGIQTIIMVQKTEHGRAIQACIPEAVLTHSTAPNRREVEEKLRSGTVFACIATPIFDTGLDTPYIGAVVYAGGGPDEIRLGQSLGRLLRQNEAGDKSPWFVDFLDTFHPILHRHSNARLKYFKGHKSFNLVQDLALLPSEVYTKFIAEITKARM